MRINGIREATVPIASAMRNAVIRFSEMTTSAVVLISDVVRDNRPLLGFGFSSYGRYAQGSILRERLIPRLLGAPADSLLNREGSNFDPVRAWSVMMANEKPGGHGERPAAVGALDMALWDLAAKIEGKPLFRLLAERCGNSEASPEVPAYAAGGYYYPEKGLTALQDEIRCYLDAGYPSVKIKIGGASLGEDLRRIEAVLEVVGEGRNLAVDANARFDLAAAMRYLEALAPYGIRWYEEPVDPLDFDALAELARAATLPLATGENLFSLPDARNLIRYGGLRRDRDILQMDPGLSYGLTEYLRMIEMMRAEGWQPRQCVPHGGHQMAAHIAAGLALGGSEAYPGIFQPFGGFADDARIEGGMLRLGEEPGIGIEGKSALYGVFRALSE